MKKTIAMLMAIAMLASMFTMAVLADEEFIELTDEMVFEEISNPVNNDYDIIVDEPNMCGLNATWEVIYGCLVINGSGAMYDYPSVEDAPWYSMNDQISGVSISGINYIGANAFTGMSFIWMQLTESVTAIGANAFSGCSSLEEIYYIGHEANWNAVADKSDVLAAITPIINIPPLGYGETENGIVWSISEDGDMEIQGFGMIPNYEYGQAPWHAYAEYVITINMTLGIDGIGDNAFNDMVNLTYVYADNADCVVSESALAGANPNVTVTKRQPEVEPEKPEEPTVLEIVDQPATIVVQKGEEAYIGLYARGDELSYEWLKSTDGGITWEETEYTESGFTIVTTSADNKTSFKCIVSDKYGEYVISEAAVLYVRTPLKIVSQPHDTEIDLGSKVQISVQAEGDSLTYRWQYSINGATWYSSNTTGAKTNSITVEGSEANDGKLYRCVVTDGKGTKVVSNAITVTIRVVTGPIIIAQPSNIVAKNGNKAVFRIAATGDGLVYRWQYSSNGGRTWYSVTSSGYNTNAITVTANAANNGKLYRCYVTDSSGKRVYSDAGILAVK